MREEGLPEQQPSLKEKVQTYLKDQAVEDARESLEAAFRAFDESQIQAYVAEGKTEAQARELIRKAGEAHYAKHYEGK